MGYIDTVRNDLVRLRRTYGISQREVAEVVGVSRTAVSAFETGSSSTMRLQALDQLISLVDQWRSFELPPEDFTKVPPEIPASPESPADVESSSGTSTCPSCSERVPGPQQDAWFCFKCGTALANRCGHCGYASVDAKARFCGHCGSSLKESAPLDHSSEEGELPEAFLDDEDELSGTPLAEELAEKVAAWKMQDVPDVADVAK